jgi:hypothetical protein
MISSNNTLEELCRKNVRTARRRWPGLDKMLVAGLLDLTLEHGFHLQHGHVQLLDGRWYVTHAGLLSLANHRGCAGIEVCPIPEFSVPAENRWVLKATVYTSATCLGFVGFGDAEPSNVSPIVRGAEMRIAETRAVNRALRKAYGIGLCSIEEIGSISGPSEPPAQQQRQAVRPTLVAANGNGHHLRDRLLVLIRQQKLDGALVKAYAADFCDVKELRDASKEQIQQFIQHLSEYAANDRDGLVCQLNSYAPKQESAA